MEYPDFKVGVICHTYNQSNYIVDTMNGFCIQQTEFPFICCIVDDASTDNEPEVIRTYINEHFDLVDSETSCQRETDYANIIFARHKENINCYFAVLLLKYNHYTKELAPKKIEYENEWVGNTKYAAFCEGDDYWIDPQKLQLQFNALEGNNDCNMCVHITMKVNANGTYTNSTYPIKTIKEGYLLPVESLGLLQDDFSFHLTSQFVRRGIFNEYESNKPLFAKVANCGDIPLLLYFGQKGNIYHINRIMSCYRLCAVGSHTESMLNDVSYRESFYDSIEVMMHEYDAYTNRKYHVICSRISSRYRFLQLQLSHYLGKISTKEYNRELIKSKYRYHFERTYPFKVRMLIYLSVVFPILNSLRSCKKL